MLWLKLENIQSVLQQLFICQWSYKKLWDWNTVLFDFTQFIFLFRKPQCEHIVMKAYLRERPGWTRRAASRVWGRRELRRNMFLSRILIKMCLLLQSLKRLQGSLWSLDLQVLVFSQSVNIWIICPHMAALQQHYNWFKALKVQIHRNLEIIYVRCL